MSPAGEAATRGTGGVGGLDEMGGVNRWTAAAFAQGQSMTQRRMTWVFFFSGGGEKEREREEEGTQSQVGSPEPASGFFSAFIRVRAEAEQSR